jgi:hypothetical protein
MPCGKTTFQKAKQVKAFLLWVLDLEAALGLSRTEAQVVADETWPDLDELLKLAKKKECQAIKEVIRDRGSFTYQPKAVHWSIVASYNPVTASRCARMESERLLGQVPEDWSELDHLNDMTSQSYH